MCIAAGTSGVVFPGGVGAFSAAARRRDVTRDFKHVRLGTSARLLPSLLGV